MRLLLLISFSWILSRGYSQEFCNNGIDDDGDGLIDCFDGECSFDTLCEDFFFGRNVTCVDGEVSGFSAALEWKSGNQTATSHLSPVIGDLNQDGVPEVVAVNSLTRRLFILSGISGITLAWTELGFEPDNTPAIADINRDGNVEIVVSENDGSNLAIYQYRQSNGVLIQLRTFNASSDQSKGAIGLADFDEDGDTEIYYRNEIIDATTGNVLIQGTGDWKKDWTNSPLAINIFGDAVCTDCNGLELVTGNEIWSVNEETGVLTLIADLNSLIKSQIDQSLSYFPKFNENEDSQWSTVSSADFNNDGHLDLIISGALGSDSDQHEGGATIFYWDVLNSEVQIFNDPSNSTSLGVGRIIIQDIDNDGMLNAIFSMGSKVYALDENLNQVWTYSANTNSDFSSPTVFDLNGNDSKEVIVKNGEKVIILHGSGNGNGSTNVIEELSCKAITLEEIVVIADIDNDGSAEICVACLLDDNGSTDNYQSTRNSQIRVYESLDEGWKSSRSIWNQYAYFNVNINDDLTIPVETQDHSVVFSSSGQCEFNDGTPIPFPARSLNTFGVQSPQLDSEGCITNIAADLDVAGIFSASTIQQCIIGNVITTFELVNLGDRSVSGIMPVSYYLGDPRNANAILLDTHEVILENLKIGEIINVDYEVFGVPNEGELYLVLNDNGSTIPMTTLPQDGISECDLNNNIISTTISYQQGADQIHASICEGDSYHFGDQILTKEGIYSEVFENETDQCTNVTLTLSVWPVEKDLTFSDGQLSTPLEIDYKYQWINCDTDELIKNATSNTYSPTLDASYSVRITTPNCETISECISVDVLSVKSDESIQLFPNPVEDVLYFHSKNSSKWYFEINSISGKTILSDHFSGSDAKVKVAELESGIYFFKAKSLDDKIFSIQKFVKR